MTQLQPPNIGDRASISVVELNELQGKSEEQQNKINNSEKLGTSGARLEARRSKVSRATFKDKKITCKGCESGGVLQEAG